MNLGILIVLITLLGYLSNWLNWRYLNNPAIKILYYLGAAVHETSHAVFCIITGARITEFSIFSKQPHVIYQKSKIPFLGNLLISLAPIFGGLTFLFLVNNYFLPKTFVLPSVFNLETLLSAPFFFLKQLDPSEWSSWLMIFLSFNIGAMIGPSFQDLKNIWPLLIICFFIEWPILIKLGFLTLALILTNLLIQLILLIFLKIFKTLTHHNFAS